LVTCGNTPTDNTGTGTGTDNGTGTGTGVGAVIAGLPWTGRRVRSRMRRKKPGRG
jgi:hypothetical protein